MRIIIFRSVLVIVVLANSAGLLALVGNMQALPASYPAFRPWMVPALALCSVGSIAACAGLWHWRRWGFALILAAYALMFVINIRFGAPTLHTAFGPLGLAMLFSASWPVRGHFDTGTA